MKRNIVEPYSVLEWALLTLADNSRTYGQASDFFQLSLHRHYNFLVQNAF